MSEPAPEIVIAELDKNARETIRVALGSYMRERRHFRCGDGIGHRPASFAPARAGSSSALALAAIAESGDAEAANGLPMAAVPKDFPVLVRRADQIVNAGLGDVSGRHRASLNSGSRKAYGKRGKHMVSIW